MNLETKAALSTATTPHSSKPPHLSPSSSLHVSGGCFHHAACVARFVKDVAASCLFHGRLPTSPHIFRPSSFPRLFPSLSFFLPPAVYLLMNSVSRACFCFPALSQRERVFFILGKDRVLRCPRWHIGAVVTRSGRAACAQVGRQSVATTPCLLCNLCAVC